MARQIRCIEISGEHVTDALGEISERLEEFGITEDNVISVQVSPCIKPIPIHTGRGTVMPTVTVSVFCWSD